MPPSRPIKLGLHRAGVSAVAAAEAGKAGRHWRRWRQGGVAISFGLHGFLALLMAATLPQFGAEARKDEVREKEPLPVEIVTRAPEPEPPKKEPEPEKKTEPKTPPIPEPPKFEPEKQPDAAKTAPPPPQRTPTPAAKAAPPVPEKPAATSPAPATPVAPAQPADPPAAPTRPSIAWNAPPPPPPADAEPPGDLGPAPRAAPTPGEGLKLEADVVALPDDKNERDKETQYWVLDPLRIDLRNGCGPVTITGTMTLNERVSDGVFRGSIQTTTRPVQPARTSRCLAQSSLYRVEIRFNGTEVTMIGAGGLSDRGVQRNGVMLLEDAYGRAIWRKR